MENDDVTRCPTCNQKPPSRLRERSPWTPIRTAEDLPKVGGWYLVTTKYGEVGDALYRPPNGWMKDEGEPIAWMPLPKPYIDKLEGKHE